MPFFNSFGIVGNAWKNLQDESEGPSGGGGEQGVVDVPTIPSTKIVESPRLAGTSSLTDVKNIRFGQTFTMNNLGPTLKLSRIDLQLRRSFSPVYATGNATEGTLFLDIYEVTPDPNYPNDYFFPVGSPIFSSAHRSLSSITTSYGVLEPFEFSDTPLLANGTRYAAVLNTSNAEIGTGKGIRVDFDRDNLAPNESLVRSNDSGQTWLDMGALLLGELRDHNIEVYVANS